MSLMRSLPVLAVVLLLAACEDPSNVGIGLVGETGGEPTVVRFDAEAVSATSLTEVTGGASRVLTAAVDDPAFGTIAARAYLDFSLVSGMDSDFRGGQVTAAELRLIPNYVYGDTTASVTIRLHDLAAEFEDDGVRADTSIGAGAVVGEYTFAPTDSVVVLPLPASWVAANDTTLRSTTFSASFHGFAIEPVSETAVVGFNVTSSRLQITESDETLALPVGKNVTTLTRTGTVDLPADRLLVQDGVGPTLRFAFPFADSASVASTAVNRALVRLFADTTALAAVTPVGFHRPSVQALTLFGVTPDSLYVPLLSTAVQRGTDGSFGFSSTELASVVQRMLLEDSPVDHFELGIVNSQPTLNVLVLHGAGSARGPEAELTVTPITR